MADYSVNANTKYGHYEENKRNREADDFERDRKAYRVLRRAGVIGAERPGWEDGLEAFPPPEVPPEPAIVVPPPDCEYD